MASSRPIAMASSSLTHLRQPRTFQDLWRRPQEVLDIVRGMRP
jgi:hypothetical protein